MFCVLYVLVFWKNTEKNTGFAETAQDMGQL